MMKENSLALDFYFKIVYLKFMRKELNIPNALSSLRMLTIPGIFLLILYSNPRNYPILIALFAFSILLDFLDGYLARKLAQETELGKILDPMADKLMVFFIVLALIIKSDFPLWLGIIIFVRDIVILAASLVLMKRKKDKTVVPSSLVGKAAFAALAVLVMVYILDLHQGLDLGLVKRFFIVLSVAFMGWSWVEYYNVYQKEKNAE